MKYFAPIIITSLAFFLAEPAADAASGHTKGNAVKPFTPELKPGDYVWHPEVSPAGPVVVFASLPLPGDVRLSQRCTDRTLDNEHG